MKQEGEAARVAEVGEDGDVGMVEDDQVAGLPVGGVA